MARPNRPEHDLVGELTQARPQAQQGDGDEQSGKADQRPGAGPQLLKQQSPSAERNLALKATLETRSRCVGCRHRFTLSRLVRARLNTLTVMFA